MIAHRLVPRLTVLAIAACVVATLATPAAAAAPSRTSSRVTVTLTCSGRTTAGRAEIAVGRALLSLACSPAAPVAIGDPNIIGDPGIMPWSLSRAVTDAPGATTSCAARGIGLPTRLVCHAISNPEQFLVIDMVQPSEPGLVASGDPRGQRPGHP
jgi:hypothetical protein